MLRSLLATGLALLIASPALADAVTYKGTLGKSEIVVELSSPIEAPDAALVGRYAYTRKGIDIPLDLVSAAPGELTLTEQRPCTEDICGPGLEAGTFPEELRGAVWALASSDDGATITGTWQDGDAAPIALTLERVGSRPVDLYEPVTVNQLLMLPSWLYDGTEDLSIDNATYDFLKTQTKLTEGQEVRWGDVAFRYVTDQRTKFPFPRITDLGGVDLSAVNTRLASRHALISASALECASHVYYGMGWISGMDASAPSLGNYDQENIEVTYLSPTLMTWVESGSTWCGGAYPNNHIDYTTIDTKTGRNLDFSRIFKGSKAGEYAWEPGQTLLDFVQAAYAANTQADHSMDADCGMTDLINSNLGIYFAKDDTVVFTLQGLPHAIMACGTDLYSAPITELRDLLTPEAAEYFPVLAN